jgi:hypothetical protein
LFEVWWYTPVIPVLRKLKQEDQLPEAVQGQPGHIAKLSQKNKEKARRWGFTPAILATEEAEIQRMEVQSQP